MNPPGTNRVVSGLGQDTYWSIQGAMGCMYARVIKTRPSGAPSVELEVVSAEPGAFKYFPYLVAYLEGRCQWLSITRDQFECVKALACPAEKESF